MTEVEINAFSRYFENTLFNNNNVCNFYDEVVIDNIPCHITLKYFVSDGRIRLILHNKNIHKKLNELVDDEDNEYLYNLLTDCDFLQLGNNISTINKSKYIMEYLRETIDNIRFCKYNGKFVHKDNIHYATIHDMLPSFFKDTTNIRFNENSDSQCCVCMDNTITTGSCSHPICIPCAIKIHPDLDGDQICPICRSILTFV
jgi:hypothetical protein